LLPLALQLASDPVPNIRFNCAKLLSTMAAMSGFSVDATQTRIKPALQRMLEDNDVDVRFFAQQALASPAIDGTSA
jgi:serine/threonine-protein phosphatase 2A regulatory subunit A